MKRKKPSESTDKRCTCSIDEVQSSSTGDLRPLTASDIPAIVSAVVQSLKENCTEEPDGTEPSVESFPG